jgi:hypothetical protein
VRYALAVLIVTTLGALGVARSHVAAAAAKKSETPGKPAKNEQRLLLLDDEPPLLLDDEPADKPPKIQGADNSRCHVCHLAFEKEELALVHAKENIGCAKCHGDCDAHIADESWASGGPGTPPGIMYPPEKIDAACAECHQEHDAPASTVVERFLRRCAEKTDPGKIVCTDCHGQHRLVPELRKAWWDKKTGKPIKPIGPSSSS